MTRRLSPPLRPALTALVVLGGLCTARPASAQPYFVGYFGVNHTRPATVSVDQPLRPLAVDFLDVEFAAEPFKSPQYYGARFGWMLGERRRFGVEVEFIHLKVIAKTDAVYDYRDRSGLLDVVPNLPMSGLVERYSMTHGLNFLLVNAVLRQPIGSSGRSAVIARAGAGPTLPHAESTVLGGSREQYEYAGMGAHAAAGLDVALAGPLSAVVEYKFTWARPEIDIASGTGRTTTASHHLAFGLTLGLAR